MQFTFDKPACQNLRKALRREWIETNGTGGYASSSLVCCNTRKYHGWLTVELADPPGRYALLSTVDESLLVGGREAAFSCRRYPDVYSPHGHEYLQESILGGIPTFVYRFGDVRLTRQIMMVQGKNQTLVRYSLECPDNKLAEPARLRLKPLLAFRNMHQLTHANVDLQVKTWPAKNGFAIRPYNALPSLFIQMSSPFVFHPSPDWYRNAEYMVEAERGFAHHEDLFQPGVIDIELTPGKSVVFSASTEEIGGLGATLAKIWSTEASRRTEEINTAQSLTGHLALAGKRFLTTDTMGGAAVVAGYHWFGAWGRDTCIALPGLTFSAGRPEAGMAVLNRLATEAHDGRIPNMFSPDGHHSYNCVDASLWYVWAAQAAFEALPNGLEALRPHCWPFIKKMINAYASGRVPHVHCDEQGFLHVGDAGTQLTWMDASVNGQPVTSRHGCPVELTALWYNALAFARRLAKRYGEERPHALCYHEPLNAMRETFVKRFWVAKRGGYLADVWRPEGPDESLRPNQLFAVGLPYAILEEDRWSSVVDAVRRTLLTPHGLRTLSPDDPAYCHIYEGGPEQRDAAYHQGTVWPWLLGIYGDALLRTAWDMNSSVLQLLETLQPLLTKHLTWAGVGSISEIFTADPPQVASGCIAQAWSVGEVLRLLCMARRAAPEVVDKWEATLR